MISIATSVIAHAQTLTGPNYTIKRARIVVSGGAAESNNYRLNFAAIGNVAGQTTESQNYSLNANQAVLDKFMEDRALDTIAPHIDSITPFDGELVELDSFHTITCFAQDNFTPPYSLYYKFILDGGTVHNWGANSAYNWDTQDLGCRMYSIRAEVKDIGGNDAYEEADVYLIHKPPQIPQ